MNYADQIEVIKDLGLDEGQSIRMDCPFCFHNNTLQLTKESGQMKWYCFSASCTAKGVKDDKLSLSSIKSRLSSEDIKEKKRSNPNEIPPIVSSIENNPRAIEYLKEVNCWNVYKTHQVHIKYTPKEDRVLFYMNNDTGAVGRYIGDPPTNKKYRISKWKVYGDTTGCFIIGEGNHAVVVEDVPSACVVSTIPGYVGVALLGTNIEHKQRQQILEYNKITFALDKDARKKSIEASNKFFFGVKPSVLLLEEDIKYINKDKLYNLLLNVI